MKTMLVGSTGFVGGNLAASHAFDGAFHSADIERAFGARPELLVYAGLPAAKYLANTDPAGDLAVVERAFWQTAGAHQHGGRVRRAAGRR